MAVSVAISVAKMKVKKYLLAIYVFAIVAALANTLLKMPKKYWDVWNLQNSEDVFASGPMGFSEENLGPVSSQFRGSIARTGVSQFDLQKEKMKMAWSSKLISNSGTHDAAKSSPAIDETGVYVGNDDGTFAAFNHDGTVKWVFKIANSAAGIHATAALDDKLVYFGGYNGTLYALDKTRGKVIWIHELSDSALGASPAVFEDSVYVSVETAKPLNGYLSRIRRTDGKTIWRSTFLGEQGHASPTIDVDHRILFAGANNGHLFAFDLDTGLEKWKFQAQGAIKSTPLYRKGFVYFGSRGGYFYKLNAETGKLVWQTNLGDRIHSSPAFVEGYDLLVVGSMNAKVNAINSLDGAIKWQYDNGIREIQASSTVIHHFGKMAVWSVCGENELCLLDPQNGRKKMSLPVSTPLNGELVPWQQSLYVALKKGGGLVKFE